jgi:uncharacterized membrane protein
VRAIVTTRCVACHAEKPSFAGFQQPPGGLRLESVDQIKNAAQKIYQQTVATQTMPIGNLTKMTDEERRILGRWIEAGAPVN